jgi:CRP/FNR family transcriptional regulator
MHLTAASHDFPCQSCPVRDQSICAALSDEELREVSKITTAVDLAKGATVFFEGDENAYLFNVVSGAVCLSKLLRDGRRQVTGFLFPGDFLGLSVADTYAYTVKLLDRFPKLELRLLELASNELIEA